MEPSLLLGALLELDGLTSAILAWALQPQYGANQEEPGPRGQTGPQESFLQEEIHPSGMRKAGLE